MTNAEAREIIKQFRDRQGNSSDDIEAFDLVIEVLDQQPCEDWRFYYNHGYAQAKRDLLCEDYVSRKQLLSRIDAERKHLLDLKMDGAEHIIVHHARRIIEDMPSVTPKTESEVNADVENILPWK